MMRFDVPDFDALKRAIDAYDTMDKSEPMILVLHTPGRILYRFLIGEHGIIRQECNATGGPIE